MNITSFGISAVTTPSIQSISLSEQIDNWLVTEITEERLKPGEKVTEQMVADRCNVSRGPVREAFREVEKIGLLQILPRRGVQVTKLDSRELSELFQMRVALNNVAIQWIDERASKEQLKNFLITCKSLLKHTNSATNYFEASNMATLEFTKLVNSKKFIELSNPVTIPLMRYRHHAFQDRKACEASAKGFVKIAEALLDNNVIKAQEVMAQMSNNLLAASKDTL